MGLEAMHGQPRIYLHGTLEATPDSLHTHDISTILAQPTKPESALTLNTVPDPPLPMTSACYMDRGGNLRVV